MRARKIEKPSSGKFHVKEKKIGGGRKGLMALTPPFSSDSTKRAHEP